MISRPSRKCKQCKDIATFGHKIQMHCEKHKKNGENNLIEKLCSNCNMVNIFGDNGVCLYCDPDIMKQKILSKQNIVKKLLDDNNFDYVYYDEVINRKCGLERPDFVFDCNTHFIILEVDEDQHKSRSEECEITRMLNIPNSMMDPVIFIRYNPDIYKVNGINQDISNYSRHQKLLEYIDRASTIDISTIGCINAIYLFYDEYDENNIDIKQLVKWDNDKWDNDKWDNDKTLSSIKTSSKVQLFRSDLFRVELESMSNADIIYTLNYIYESCKDVQNIIDEKRKKLCSEIDILLNIDKEAHIKRIISHMKTIRKKDNDKKLFINKLNNKDYINQELYTTLNELQFTQLKKLGNKLDIKDIYKDLIKPIYKKIVSRLNKHELIEIIILNYNEETILKNIQNDNDDITDIDITNPLYIKLDKLYNVLELKNKIKEVNAKNFYIKKNFDKPFHLGRKKDLIETLISYYIKYDNDDIFNNNKTHDIFTVDLDNFDNPSLKKLGRKYKINDTYHNNSEQREKFDGRQFNKLKKAQVLELLNNYIKKHK